MVVQRVLTLTDGLPVPVIDAILTTVEEALREAGAEHVWIDRSTTGLSVLATLP
jgi:hypothetical protein